MDATPPIVINSLLKYHGPHKYLYASYSSPFASVVVMFACDHNVSFHNTLSVHRLSLSNTE